MKQTPLFPQQSVTYFFLKSKDEHMENGLSTITLFAKLAREIAFLKSGKMRTQVETFWFQIEDLKMEQLTEKVKGLPNCIQKYELSEKVFHHLLQLSQSCPKELYWVTPYYMKVKREMFMSWQELEQCGQKR